MAHFVVPPDAVVDSQGRTRPAPALQGSPDRWWTGGWIVSSSMPGATVVQHLIDCGLGGQPHPVWVVAVLDGMGSEGDRHDVDQLVDLSGLGLPDMGTGPFQTVVRLDALLEVWDTDRAAEYATLRRRWLRENGHPRTIDNTGVLATHPWPDDARVQGGDRGIVFTRDPERPSYRTAFVEAFLSEPSTFVRGEGQTVQEAEDACWAKVSAVLDCPTGHADLETRGYRNGVGFCTSCGMMRSGAFDVEDVGWPCATCGVGCYHACVDDRWYCEEHAPEQADED